MSAGWSSTLFGATPCWLVPWTVEEPDAADPRSLPSRRATFSRTSPSSTAVESIARSGASVFLTVHGKDADPFFAEDLEAAQALVDSTDRAELFLYPGDEHLFADPSLPAYDAAAAAVLSERVLAFLSDNAA